VTNVARLRDSIVTHKVLRLSLDLITQTGAVSSYLLVREDCPHWLSRQICPSFIIITYRVSQHNDGLL